MGYIDQYILFPKQVRKRLKALSKNTLLVFTDNALGPWVPLAKDRVHVIHCHDFLAQRSALDEMPQNPTSWTGKQYQAFIRRGYRQGKNFISVSKKTQEDLEKFVESASVKSTVVYNGLNNSFGREDVQQARSLLQKQTGIVLSSGYLLHVGGNQWYKNREGVIEIYDAWRSSSSSIKLPLVLIGEQPSLQLTQQADQSSFKEDIHFMSQVEDKFVRIAYAGASVFLFPSYAEGFGWPIAEAMACGCPVITTNAAPMTEVAGNAGFFIEPRPIQLNAIDLWKNSAATELSKILALSPQERENVINKGIENAKTV